MFGKTNRRQQDQIRPMPELARKSFSTGQEKKIPRPHPSLCTLAHVHPIDQARLAEAAKLYVC
jgi:hypothetical protein